MVNKPLLRPYFQKKVRYGGVDSTSHNPRISFVFSVAGSVHDALQELRRASDRLMLEGVFFFWVKSNQKQYCSAVLYISGLFFGKIESIKN